VCEFNIQKTIAVIQINSNARYTEEDPIYNITVIEESEIPRSKLNKNCAKFI
jgi:hypothetical protein